MNLKEVSMRLHYYSFFVLLLVINIHVFADTPTVIKTTKDFVYVDFNEYMPTKNEVYNIYNSRIENNGKTIYEKLLGSAYYTGNKDSEGELLKLLFENRTALPQNCYAISTGQILTTTQLTIENFNDTLEELKKEDKKDTKWSFDTSLSSGGSYVFFASESFTKYSLNLGILYKNALRIRISPVLPGNDNLLLNINLDMSLMLDFNDPGLFIYLGLYPYQKNTDDFTYQFTFGTGYHMHLFDSNIFLELATDSTIVTFDVVESPYGYSEDPFNFDVHFSLLASIGYSY